MLKKRIVLCMFFVISFSGMALMTNRVMASSRFISNITSDRKQKVGGKTFVAKQYQEGEEYKCKIIMKSGSKSTVIAKNTNCDFVTNGNVIYYTKSGVKNTIIKCNIRTGKKTKVISGYNYMVRGCSNDNYLYYGIDEGADGTDLYALNLKTKRKRHMVSGVGSAILYKKYVVTDTNSGAVGNYPINVFKLNGTGKKKIVDGCLLKVSGNKIYYATASDDCSKFKIYTCTLKGKNKKAISGWLERIPAKYFEQ